MIENINPGKGDKYDGPDETGLFENAKNNSNKKKKNKKKKSTKALLPFGLPVLEDQEQPSKEPISKPSILGESLLGKKSKEQDEEFDLAKSDADSDVTEKTSNSSELANQAEALVGTSTQEQVDQADLDGSELQTSSSEYMGELIIDHADDAQPGVINDVETAEVEAGEELIQPQESPELSETLNYRQVTENVPVAKSETDSQGAELKLITEDAVSGIVDNLDQYPNSTTPHKTNQPGEVTYSAIDAYPHPHLFNFNNMINPNSELKEGAADKVHQPSRQRQGDTIDRSRRLDVNSGAASLPFLGWLFNKRSHANQERRIHDLEDKQSQTELDLHREKVLSNKRLILLEKARKQVHRAPSRMESFRPSNEGVGRSDKFTTERLVHDKANKNNAPLKPELSTSEAKEIDSSKDNKELQDNRVELSAWHRVELDKKTGRLAESPSVEYGKEFAKEQQQERLATGASQAYSAVHLASVALAANGASSQTSVSNSPSIPDSTSDSLGRDKPTKSPITLSYISSQITQNTFSPTTWFWAVITIFILYLLGFLG